MRALLHIASTSLVRIFLLTASILAAATLLPASTRAQTPLEIPAPSDTVYEVRLGDGSLIFASIAEVDQELVVLATVGGGRLEVGRVQIRGLRPARGRVANGEFWREDSGTTRLLFTATGRTLGQGKAYVGTYLIALPFVAIGLTDRVTIAAGAPVLFGEFEPFYLGPRVQVLRTPTEQVSLGTLAFFFDDEVVGIVYGVGTFGDSDNALSAGVGYFYSGDEVLNEPAFMLGGEVRVSRRIKVITENYVLPDAVGMLLAGGVRIIGDRFSTEIAIAGVAADGERECCVPIVNFSYAFGR